MKNKKNIDDNMLKTGISRRSFIKNTTVIGATSILAVSHLGGLMKGVSFAAGHPDITAVQGSDAYANTIRAVDMIGGMDRFVSGQDRVAILVNSGSENPGAYVKPEIVLAVIGMCLEAGAREIGLFKKTGNSYWRKTPAAARFKDEIRKFKSIGGSHTKVEVKGVSLKEAQVSRALLDWDVFINIPIAKDHTGVIYTGTMKNMMGLTAFTTNRFFHFGGGKGGGWYDDPQFLSQCIADVNLVRRPDLCVYDCMENLITNGPSGPGQLARPRKVFAATDAVAADVYGANLIGVPGEDILATRMAYEHGMGRIDLNTVRIEEAVL